MKLCTKCLSVKPLERFALIKGGPKRLPHCKECKKTAKKIWAQNNKERVVEYKRVYELANAEGKSAMQRRYYQKNRERCIAAVLRYQSENKESRRAYMQAYFVEHRCIMRLATPQWADNKKINAVYRRAAELREQTGQELQVDHVVPIMGRRVCGLHVENNLQIIPAKDNRSKFNHHS